MASRIIAAHQPCYLPWLGYFDKLKRVDEFLTRMSALEFSGQKSALVMSLCLAVGATKYLSGASAREYIDVDEFKQHGIEVEFQTFEHPVYPQVHGGDFVPNLGIVDYLMNV